MLLSQKEITKWLGLTMFEIFTNVISLMVFTILLLIYYDPSIEFEKNYWWYIFIPLFVADLLNAYFCVIVFVRMTLETGFRIYMARAIWSTLFLSLFFLFKYLLCRKLLKQVSLEYSEVFAPIYVLLQFIGVRACQQT